MPGKSRWRIWFLIAVTLAGCVAVGSRGPIPQDVSYHSFADQRTLFGVPNFWNVVSNLPFLFVGIAGIVVLLSGRSSGALPELRPSFFSFFIGAALVAIGSGYYHLAPDNTTLVFDRLPMTVAFMAFFAIILGEHIDPGIGRLWLVPLLILGSASVLYWWFTESRGHGDLRPYALVQYLPVVLIPLILILFPSRMTKVGLIWALLGAYVLAKVLELLDQPIYDGLGISGHTLKHLVAAAGMFLLVVALRARTVASESPGPDSAGVGPETGC